MRQWHMVDTYELRGGMAHPWAQATVIKLLYGTRYATCPGAWLPDVTGRNLKGYSTTLVLTHEHVRTNPS